MKRVEVAGVILAGGNSKRFGSNKAFAHYKGVPFYEWSIRAMTSAVQKCVVVTNKYLENEYKKRMPISTYVDHSSFSQCGPLGGLYTAMTQVSAEWYVVLPVDVPYIKASTIQYIIDSRSPEHKAIIPVINGKKQPLIAAYHYSIKNDIHKQLSSGDFRMNSLIGRLEVRYLDEEEIGNNAEISFRNINTVDEFEHFKLQDCDIHHKEK